MESRNSSPGPKGSLRLGSAVPSFKIAATPGNDISLGDLRGKKVVLYFYPKDNTPGCTIQGVEFNKLHAEFQKANTAVFGISRDSLKSHDSFKSKFGFKFELLSDADEAVCKLFDVIKEKNMYGRKVMGIERSTFVIGEDGQLLAEYRKVKAEGHAQMILDFVKGL
jgi:peroxiredoxin Q/BCP